MKDFLFIVNEKFNNYKCFDFLKNKGISLEIIQKIKVGGVFVNDVLLNNINNLVKTDDVVKIVLPNDEKNTFIKPKKGNLKIVYEDEYMLAVIKEKGVLTHLSKHNETPSLDELVCGYFYPENFTFRAINRLDKDTSGIILIAKDMLTASLLGEQMKRGEFLKTYSAIIVGKPEKSHFIIEKPIKKQEENSVKRICSDDGKYAKTECFFVRELSQGLSLIDVILHTGRTHQIRVHLSYIGYPLYADSLYGKEVKNQNYSLHAKKLEFIHPYKREKMIIEG